MTRVDVKGAVHLVVPECSTVIVISTDNASLSLDRLSPRDPLKPAFLANDVVLAALQDYLRFGPEDADNEGKVTRLVSAAMASGAPYDEIFRDVGQTALETGLEGSRIGKPSLKLATVHAFLMGAIEEAMTAPAPQARRVS